MADFVVQMYYNVEDVWEIVERLMEEIEDDEQ